MKINFESREKQILFGLLTLPLSAAKDAKAKPMVKYIKRLLNKFKGDSDSINLKPNELNDLGSILETVIAETTFDLPEGVLPKISQTDFDICKTIKDKIEVALAR